MKMIGLVAVLVASLWQSVMSCSNIIVSPGASADSSSIVAYNADSGSLYGQLYHYPAADHKASELRDVYDWDSGVFLGQIPEIPHTYNVVGNVNEHGLIIGETTFGGISALMSQSGAKIDYGSLIWITLQRSRTAREAISTISYLMKTFGYASEGESFSIADQNEAWIMEIIGKGNYELGAVWVAVRVPDGYVSAHANQARITTFPLHDPDSCLYSDDVISFAKKVGLYPAEALDEKFSFSDVYDPVTFFGARFCEARVWSFFGSLMGDAWASTYLDYAQGYNLTNRMPLFVKPPNKLSLSEVMEHMRNHYEDTQLDMAGKQFSDVGALYSSATFRASPLTWTSTVKPDGSTGTNELSYFNERPIATHQTGWNFVAQSRRWMPAQLSAVLWFGVDDSSTTVRFPIYGSSTKVPSAFGGKGTQDGVTPPMMTFSWDSAFYVFNVVANYAYPRWADVYPTIYAKIISLEGTYMDAVKAIDSKASQIFDVEGAEAAVELVTSFAVDTGNQLVKNWGLFFGELFVRYRDGFTISSNPENTACGCSIKSEMYPQSWYNRIVEDTGGHYAVPTQSLSDSKFMPKSKVELLKRK